MRDFQVIPIRRLIDDVVLHGRRHWRQILPSVALMLFGIGLLTLLLQEKQMQMMENPNPSLDEAFGVLAIVFPLLFVFLAVYMAAFSAVMVACMDALEGRAVSMGRAWSFSLRPQVFLTNGLVWFLTGISVLCCFFPVLYVGTILTFTLPIMVHRGIFGFQAIGASFELSKYNPSGRWWEGTFVHILGVLVAGALINYALSMLVQLPLIVMQAVMAFRQAASGDLTAAPLPPLWMQVPTQGLVALVTAASWIYWCFGIAALYREVLRRKEGGDLQSAIDQVTTGPGAGPISGPPSAPGAVYPSPSNPSTEYPPPSSPPSEDPVSPTPPAPSWIPSTPVPPAPSVEAPSEAPPPPRDVPPDDTSEPSGS